MLGNPKFAEGNNVRFKLADGVERHGFIYIVDKFGTLEQNIDVSYDIMVDSENCLYKHIIEKYVYA